jgi:hypothetical protein
MYRDFVSWYGPDGAKIRTLVFVLIHKGQPKYIFNVYWGKEAGCDTFFYRDAMSHLLGKTNMLDQIKTLYISGDHGPHFRSRRAFYFDSTVFELTKTWREESSGLKKKKKKNNKKIKMKRKKMNSYSLAGLEIECHFLPSYHAFNRCDGAGMFLKWACVKYWREGVPHTHHAPRTTQHTTHNTQHTTQHTTHNTEHTTHNTQHTTQGVASVGRIVLATS